MEKLSRRSDGFFETPSGHFAIQPRAVSGKRDGTSWFEFKASTLGEVIRFEWPTGAPVIAIDQTMARTMIARRYAFNINDQLMADYNAAVDAYLAGVPAAPAAPAVEPPPVPDAPIPAAPAATGKKGK